MDVRRVETNISKELIIKHHYSHRAPNAMYAFGLFDGDSLVGVVTFGKPSSPQVAKSIAPTKQEIVLELNRLVITTSAQNAASRLVGRALHLLPRNSIIVSFADRGQNHIGFVYQSTNFFFAGETKPHDSEYIIDGKRVHPRTMASRGITNPRQWAREHGIEWVSIEPKYRYVFLRGVNPKEIKWPLSKDYPKGDPVFLNRKDE